jgi:hypothetical protein
MKNNLVKQTILRAVGKAAELEVKKLTSDWQGVCIGFLHQPRRPLKK